MITSLRAIGTVACLALFMTFALPQDGLGKKKGGGGSEGGSGSGGGNVDKNRGGGNSGGGQSGGGSGLGRGNGGGNSGGSGGSGLGRGTGGGQSSGGQTGGGGLGRGTGGGQGGGSTIGGGQGQNNGGLGRSNGGSGGVHTGPPVRAGGQVPGNTVGNGLLKQSRSGKVNYGSSNNIRPEGPGIKLERARIGQLHQLDRQIQRSEARVGIVHGGRNNYGYRWGYIHYDRGWRDDRFWYPYYVFDPFSYNRFVCSPWYYYTFLPPYLNTTRIITINNYYGYGNWTGDPYRWERPRRDDRSRRYSDLDYAVDDIVAAFEERDRRAVTRLIPRSGSIAMYMDGQYNYSLNPDDFYDLYMDLLDNARTSQYRIEDVRSGRGVARVTARHDYTDPWGRRETVYHHYTLEDERGYVIREFGTSYDRRW